MTHSDRSRRTSPRCDPCRLRDRCRLRCPRRHRVLDPLGARARRGPVLCRDPCPGRAAGRGVLHLRPFHRDLLPTLVPLAHPVPRQRGVRPERRGRRRPWVPGLQTLRSARAARGIRERSRRSAGRGGPVPDHRWCPGSDARRSHPRRRPRRSCPRLRADVAPAAAAPDRCGGARPCPDGPCTPGAHAAAGDWIAGVGRGHGGRVRQRTPDVRHGPEDLRHAHRRACDGWIRADGGIDTAGARLERSPAPRVPAPRLTAPRVPVATGSRVGGTVPAALAVRRPLDGAGLADWFADRAIEGVEHVDSGPVDTGRPAAARPRGPDRGPHGRSRSAADDRASDRPARLRPRRRPGPTDAGPGCGPGRDGRGAACRTARARRPPGRPPRGASAGDDGSRRGPAVGHHRPTGHHAADPRPDHARDRSALPRPCPRTCGPSTCTGSRSGPPTPRPGRRTGSAGPPHAVGRCAQHCPTTRPTVR
jgi:hypothetical protein